MGTAEQTGEFCPGMKFIELPGATNIVPTPTVMA
jgi:hypothetical protein